jgi:hypothetical protein
LDCRPVALRCVRPPDEGGGRKNRGNK